MARAVYVRMLCIDAQFTSSLSLSPLALHAPSHDTHLSPLYRTCAYRVLVKPKLTKFKTKLPN